VVLMAIVFLQGAQVPAFQDDPVVVGAVEPGSPAETVGVRPGDRIVEVAGRGTATWEQFFMAIGTHAKREVPMKLLHEGRELTVQIVPKATTRFEVGDIGVLPNVHPRIRSVDAGSPAARAGLKAGDLVVALNDQPIIFAKQLSDGIKKYPEKPITLAFERSGSRQSVSVTPQKQGSVGIIGVGIDDALKMIQPGPIQAFKMSLQKNVQFGGLIFQTLWGLITRETSPRQLMGPVAIAQLSGEYAAAGWMALFTLMASISLNLGLLNLLPIPVLDGGHIFIMALEGVARRDFSIKVKEKMLLAGFVVLVMLMVTVIYNDLTRIQWIEHLMPWRR
jgi:regulator of sigma E protease